MIDAAGKLTVRPLGNGASGNLGANSGGGEQAVPWYDQRESITSAVIMPGVYTTWANYMFYGCKNMTSADVSGLDTSRVSSFYSMFEDCSSLVSLDLRNFDTSKAWIATCMFKNCKSLKSLDISSFDTSNMSDFEHMFYNCESLTSLDVSGFNTANVTSMNAMFSKCANLTSLDLSSFNTAKNTSISSMFDGCEKLVSLDVSSLDTSQLTSFFATFRNCKSLTTLDLSNFNTANATNMSNMFSKCTALTSVNVSSFSTAKVTSFFSMFYNCPALTELDLSSFETTSATDMRGMFQGCTALEVLDISRFNLDDVAHSYQLYITQGCPKISRLTLPGGQNLAMFNLPESLWVDTAGNIFETTDAMKTDNKARPEGAETYVIPTTTEGWERSGTCEWMVDSAGKLTVRPLPNMERGKLGRWNPGWVPWMNHLTSITSVYIEPNVVADYCGSMFSDCKNLVSVDISNLETAQAQDLSFMFGSCEKLASIDLSSLDTANATNLSGMFYNCLSLTSLDVSGLSTAKATNLVSMFQGCNSLTLLVDKLPNLLSTNLLVVVLFRVIVVFFLRHLRPVATLLLQNRGQIRANRRYSVVLVRISLTYSGHAAILGGRTLQNPSSYDCLEESYLRFQY